VISAGVVQQLSFTLEQDIPRAKIASKQDILGFGV